MIWLITIVTFLGVAVAVMFVFWFFSQKEQILAALRKAEEHRMEARIPTSVGLELSGPDDPNYEITFTENISDHGARVVTKRRWSPNDSVLVKLPQEALPFRARITYCRPSKRDEFAMGLEFPYLIYEWDNLAIHSHQQKNCQRTPVVF
jgi:hypothetical protein